MIFNWIERNIFLHAVINVLPHSFGMLQYYKLLAFDWSLNHGNGKLWMEYYSSILWSPWLKLKRKNDSIIIRNFLSIWFDFSNILFGMVAASAYKLPSYSLCCRWIGAYVFVNGMKKESNKSTVNHMREREHWALSIAIKRNLYVWMMDMKLSSSSWAQDEK